jgi:hypothetical protein
MRTGEIFKEIFEGNQATANERQWTPIDLASASQFNVSVDPSPLELGTIEVK